MGRLSESEELQRHHYDAIASEYERHYGDPWSQGYRWRFMNEPMLEGLGLSGVEVVDALCGSGETTGYLLQRGARVTGVDISRTCCQRSVWGSLARRSSSTCC